MERAADLYQWDLLPADLYDDWTTNMRAQLRHIYLQVLANQIELYQLQGKLTLAIKTCCQYLALEPENEQICKLTMNLLWQNRQKQQAMQLYQELSVVLAREFDVFPTEETNLLYKEIRERHYS